MSKFMELYSEGNLIFAKLEALDKRFDELKKGRTLDEFAEEATEDEAIELMILCKLREECERDYKNWRKKKDEYCKG